MCWCLHNGQALPANHSMIKILFLLISYSFSTMLFCWALPNLNTVVHSWFMPYFILSRREFWGIIDERENGFCIPPFKHYSQGNSVKHFLDWDSHFLQPKFFPQHFSSCPSCYFTLVLEIYSVSSFGQKLFRLRLPHHQGPQILDPTRLSGMLFHLQYL